MISTCNILQINLGISYIGRCTISCIENRELVTHAENFNNTFTSLKRDLNSRERLFCCRVLVALQSCNNSPSTVTYDIFSFYIEITMLFSCCYPQYCIGKFTHKKCLEYVLIFFRNVKCDNILFTIYSNQQM